MATVGGRIDVEGDVKIDGHILAQDDMVVYGSVALGSADSHELTVTGQMIVRNDQVRDPTTWTILRHDGPNHLGDCCAMWLPEHQMALITTGCCVWQGQNKFSVDPLHGDTFVAGSLTIEGASQFANSVELGRSSAVRDPTTWTVLQKDGPNHLG